MTSYLIMIDRGKLLIYNRTVIYVIGQVTGGSVNAVDLEGGE